MLTIEDYIAQRKQEDHLNEFDKNAVPQNMQTCVNYVFEYFNNYLDVSKMDEQTVLNNERIDKYRKQIDQYDEDIQDWLVNIYEDHDKQLNRSLNSILKKNELFFLCSTDSEFRSISYDCYAQLIKKHPYLKDDTEMLFRFIKNHHKLKSRPSEGDSSLLLSDEMNQWIEKTWSKYHVNIVAFAEDWVIRFENNPDTWPAKHRRKSKSQWLEYEYDFKQKHNLFNLDTLYSRLPKKAFIRGKKQFFEILMMYLWLHSIVGDEEGYWEEYLNKVSPS